MDITEDPSGGSYQKTGKYKVWLLPGTVGHMSRMDFRSYATEKVYYEKFLIPKTSVRFLITGEDCLEKIVHSDLEHHRGKNPEYFPIANCIEDCTAWVLSGSQIYVFYSDKEMFKLCQ